MVGEPGQRCKRVFSEEQAAIGVRDDEMPSKTPLDARTAAKGVLFYSGSQFTVTTPYGAYTRTMGVAVLSNAATYQKTTQRAKSIDEGNPAIGSYAGSWGMVATIRRRKS